MTNKTKKEQKLDMKITDVIKSMNPNAVINNPVILTLFCDSLDSDSESDVESDNKSEEIELEPITCKIYI
jgi:hypothetical protein